MKWVLNILLLLLIQPAFSQEDPGALANRLTQSCKTNREKVTAIFRWITDNIEYNTQPRYRRAAIGAASARNNRDIDDDTGPLKPLNERVAETVLQKRIALCEGYARLFTTLCDYAGVPSAIIPGYAKTNMNRSGPRFGVNHYWNAVFIDTNWHLLDATWASGYVSWRGDEFVKQYDSHYFLTPPQEFIKDHYPDDLQWTLLADPTTPKEFKNSPFRQKSFLKYRITSYYPSSGFIEALVGDTIRLNIETSDPQRDLQITPDLLIDSSIFSRSGSWVFLQPVRNDSSLAISNIQHYEYPVVTPNVEWLFLLYNDDLVLRYKIRVRKDEKEGTD